MTLTTRVSLTLTCNARKALDLADNNTVADIAVSFLDDLANGTGLDQVNQVYADTATLTATTRTTYDVVASIDDAFGDQMSFTRLKGIYLRNRTAATETSCILQLGGGSDGAGTNGIVNWVANNSDMVQVGPGGFIMLYDPSAAGYACAGGTDILGIYNLGSATATFDLILFGCV